MRKLAGAESSSLNLNRPAPCSPDIEGAARGAGGGGLGESWAREAAAVRGEEEGRDFCEARSDGAGGRAT